MEKLKKLGVNPEMIKGIIAKVEKYKATHKAEGNDPEQLVKTIVEGMVGHPVNFDDYKETIAKVEKNISKVNSGHIDISEHHKKYH
jgi:hypothetical protein